MVSERQAELILAAIGLLLVVSFVYLGNAANNSQYKLVSEHLPEYLCTPYFDTDLLGTYSNDSCAKWISISEQPKDLLCSVHAGANQTICRTLLDEVDKKARRCKATGPTPDVPLGHSQIKSLCVQWLGSSELIDINFTVI